MTDTPMGKPQEPAEPRLRQHPAERFAKPVIAIDLKDVADRLRVEPGAGEDGHRQESLYSFGGYTAALFVFGKFTRLREHKAKGVVSIHVLKGLMKVTAGDEVHEMHGGQILMLAPGVLHSLAALDESEVLVSVNLGAAPGGPQPGAVKG